MLAGDATLAGSAIQLTGVENSQQGTAFTGLGAEGHYLKRRDHIAGIWVAFFQVPAMIVQVGMEFKSATRCTPVRPDRLRASVQDSPVGCVAHSVTVVLWVAGDGTGGRDVRLHRGNDSAGRNGEDGG